MLCMVGSGNGASEWAEMLIGHVWGGPVVGTTPFPLSMRTVSLVFQFSGVKPVAHIILKSLCIVWLKVGGSIVSTSFTTPSRPGDLLLLNDRMHSWNTAWSMIEECSQGLSRVPFFSSFVICDSSSNGSGACVQTSSRVSILTSHWSGHQSLGQAKFTEGQLNTS